MPDGNTDVCIYADEEGGWYYSVTEGEQDVIKKSRIGIIMQEGSLYRGLQLVDGSISNREIKEQYELFTGNNAVLENESNVTAGTGDTVTVLDKRSEIALPKDCTSWAFGLNGTYEGIYEKSDGVYEIIE